nr:eukaryotic translation initiation factor 2D-like isoform X2 [Procambarus clarkii]
MFVKPFRIKSQTQLKGSDRKKLRAELSQAYPSLTSEDLSKLIPGKEDVTLVRMYCYKGESVNVYQVQKDPIFFTIDKDKVVYPTVYLLWRHPELMHTFTTHTHVIGVLAGGADLMLPGIITKGEMSPYSYGKFEKGFPVAINTTDNKAPQAVGVTAHSSMDMYMCGRHGKGVSILHVYRDQLWEMGSRSPPPTMGPPDIILSGQVVIENEDSAEEIIVGSETDESEKLKEISPEQVTDDVEKLILLEEPTPDSSSNLSPENSTPKEDTPQTTGPEAMDKLLLHCFLKAWKTSGKKVALPILTSNFYRLHMIPACPDGASLDIKKSSYKKLSKEETSIKPEANKKDNSRTFTPPLIEEVHQVSGDTLHFFKANGLSKGDVLSMAEVRSIVTDYIKVKGLQKEGHRMVNLDTLLHEAVVNRKEGYKETLRWDEIFSRMLGRMAPAVRITRQGSVPVIRKGKLELIELAVAKRSGNKKVTLVYNASLYGIDEAEFAHQIQVGVAASTSVGPAEHKPQGTTQVLIQGNQVAFIGKLLLETYQIPRKYIRGLELAPKNKK